MCGIFGYIGPGPDLGILRQIGLEASRRGPHAFGLAWFNGQLQVYKQPGKLESNLKQIDRVQSALWLIGQARLATSGTWKEDNNNQPLLSVDQSVALVHNGNVYNDRAIFDQTGYSPETTCDSEAILAALKKCQGDVSRAVELIDKKSPIALLVAMGDSIYAYRDRHPLFRLDHSTGTYFCSRPLPEMVLIEARTVQVY